MDFRSSDHVSCESEHRFIVELLNTRSYEPRGSKKYDLLSAKIRVQLKQFEASVRTLRHKLEDEFNLYPLLVNTENREVVSSYSTISLIRKALKSCYSVLLCTRTQSLPSAKIFPLEDVFFVLGIFLV